MEPDTVPCNDCGSTDWKAAHTNTYPERRKEREQTVENIYVCKSCGSEGKHFENNDGAEILSGALRV